LWRPPSSTRIGKCAVHNPSILKKSLSTTLTRLAWIRIRLRTRAVSINIKMVLGGLKRSKRRWSIIRRLERWQLLTTSSNRASSRTPCTSKTFYFRNQLSSTQTIKCIYVKRRKLMILKSKDLRYVEAQPLEAAGSKSKICAFKKSHPSSQPFTTSRTFKSK